MVVEIFIVLDESDSTYGHRRIKRNLRKKGIRASNNRIRRIMRENGLISVLKSKSRPQLIQIITIQWLLIYLIRI